MANKKSLMTFFIINIVAILAAVIIYASFAWYVPNSPTGYLFELTADNVFSIYFSSQDVETEGELIPAVAMKDAVAEGRHFDVNKLYDESDPENERSYVSQTASAISYATKFTSSSLAAILVEYDWYIALAPEIEEDDPENGEDVPELVMLDKGDFIFNISFYDIARAQELIPDENDRFYATPIGDTNMVEIAVNVELMFSQVDELLDPRYKDNVFWVTVDVKRIWELEKNGYLGISFDSTDPEVEGELYPENPPIKYIKNFVYTGTTNYLADIGWEVEHNYEIRDPSLYNVVIKFFVRSTQQQIMPDANGRINFPAQKNIVMEVEVSFAHSLEYMQLNYPDMLEFKHSINIAIGTAP